MSEKNILMLPVNNMICAMAHIAICNILWEMAVLSATHAANGHLETEYYEQDCDECTEFVFFDTE